MSVQIPIKFKQRLFEAKRERWFEVFARCTPRREAGRGQTTSSMIPNLEKSELEEYLLCRYSRAYCVFTNCASDALDLCVRALNFPRWQVPSYTWVSPVNAIYKSGAEIHFLDVQLPLRTVDYSSLDPSLPLLLPHVDGYAAEKPPVKLPFILEDAAQSPFSTQVNFGDAIVMSFGSSKRLGFMGQGGCLLTDNEKLAREVCELGLFGLNDKRELVRAGDKSFLDPFNAACTLELYRHYDEGSPLTRLDEIRKIYDEAWGWTKPQDLERYTLLVGEREAFAAKLAEVGIESRVWFKEHCARWPIYQKYAEVSLPNSEIAARGSLDVPFHEFLSDQEVESISSALRSLKSEHKWESSHV